MDSLGGFLDKKFEQHLRHFPIFGEEIVRPRLDGMSG